MEEICVGKGIVTAIKFIFGLFGCKTMNNCVYNKTAEETLHINWWDNYLLRMLVVY